MVVDYLVNLGFDVIKEKVSDYREEQIIRERLESVLKRDFVNNEFCSIDEEVDFGKLTEYIRGSLLDDLKICLLDEVR